VSWSSRVFGERVPIREVRRPLQDVSWSSRVFGFEDEVCRGEYGIKRGRVCRWVRVPMPCPGPG